MEDMRALLKEALKEALHPISARLEKLEASKAEAQSPRAARKKEPHDDKATPTRKRKRKKGKKGTPQRTPANDVLSALRDRMRHALLSVIDAPYLASTKENDLYARDEHGGGLHFNKHFFAFVAEKILDELGMPTNNVSYIKIMYSMTSKRRWYHTTQYKEKNRCGPLLYGGTVGVPGPKLAKWLEQYDGTEEQYEDAPNEDAPNEDAPNEDAPKHADASKPSLRRSPRKRPTSLRKSPTVDMTGAGDSSSSVNSSDTDDVQDNSSDTELEVQSLFESDSESLLTCFQCGKPFKGIPDAKFAEPRCKACVAGEFEEPEEAPKKKKTKAPKKKKTKAPKKKQTKAPKKKQTKAPKKKTPKVGDLVIAPWTNKNKTITKHKAYVFRARQRSADVYFLDGCISSDLSYVELTLLEDEPRWDWYTGKKFTNPGSKECPAGTFRIDKIGGGKRINQCLCSRLSGEQKKGDKVTRWFPLAFCIQRFLKEK